MAQHHWLTVGSIYQSTIIQSIWQGTILQMMLPHCNCDTLEDNKLGIIPSYNVHTVPAWAKGSSRHWAVWGQNPWFSNTHLSWCLYIVNQYWALRMVALLQYQKNIHLANLIANTMDQLRDAPYNLTTICDICLFRNDVIWFCRVFDLWC